MFLFHYSIELHIHENEKFRVAKTMVAIGRQGSTTGDSGWMSMSMRNAFALALMLTVFGTFAVRADDPAFDEAVKEDQDVNGLAWRTGDLEVALEFCGAKNPESDAMVKKALRALPQLIKAADMEGMNVAKVVAQAKAAMNHDFGSIGFDCKFLPGIRANMRNDIVQLTNEIEKGKQ